MHSDMGGHIDGFIAVVAQTVVIGASAENKVTGRLADVVQAAYTCSEAALRKINPGVQVQYYNVCCLVASPKVLQCVARPAVVGSSLCKNYERFSTRS